MKTMLWTLDTFKFNSSISTLSDNLWLVGWPSWELCKRYFTIGGVLNSTVSVCI